LLGALAAVERPVGQAGWSSSEHACRDCLNPSARKVSQYLRVTSGPIDAFLCEQAVAKRRGASGLDLPGLEEKAAAQNPWSVPVGTFPGMGVNIVPGNAAIGPYYVRLVKDEQFRAYDSATGERLAVINLTDSKKKSKRKRRFVMVFVDIPSFTTDEKLAAFEKVLLMHLTWHMNSSNEVRLMQDELAKDLGVHQPTISKALKRLWEARYITCPRRGVIRVDPDFAWRDSLEMNEKAPRE
jgi:hypothetical protein